MSLGDELRYLRARAGGPSPLEIAEACGVEAGLYRQLEQRYREMGDEETLQKLSVYFGCEAALLQQARSHSRKALSAYLAKVQELDGQIKLRLRTGETLQGRLAWWDMAAIGLHPDDGGTLIVLQRHVVVDW